MTDINSVVLIGRVTHDIGERDYGYAGQTAKLTVSVAVNRSVKRNDEWQNEAAYFDVVVWGKTAESLKAKLHKGQQVGVSGSLWQDRWEKEGKKNSKIYVNASDFRILEKTSTSDSSSSTSYPSDTDDLGF